MSKRYSSGYFPVADAYVEYDVELTNTADIPVKNQSLRVSLVSESNKTHSIASYSIPLLSSGESKILHFGPFKMQDEGEHRLLVEMNGENNSTGNASIDYQRDSFIVYRQDAILTLLISIPLIATGAGIAGFSIHKRIRGRRV
jgi:hypothetical protein